MKSLPGRICRVLFFDTNEARAISGAPSRCWEDGVGHAGTMGKVCSFQTARHYGAGRREAVKGRFACSGKSITR